MRKVSVVGGGNAGVFTALYFAWYGQDEVELIYNPQIPPESCLLYTSPSPRD